MSKTLEATKAGERTQVIDGEFLANNESVSIYKPDMHPIGKMVRLYCTQHATSWKLQIRGTLGIGCNGMRKGKSSVIAGVDLSIPQMVDLRNAINEFISEAQAAITRAEAA